MLEFCRCLKLKHSWSSPRLVGLLTLTWLEMAVVSDQSARCGTALGQSEALQSACQRLSWEQGRNRPEPTLLRHRLSSTGKAAGNGPRIEPGQKANGQKVVCAGQRLALLGGRINYGQTGQKRGSRGGRKIEGSRKVEAITRG